MPGPSWLSGPGKREHTHSSAAPRLIRALHWTCHSAQTPDGRTITPDMVVTASKPGRKVLLLGNCHTAPGPDSALAQAAAGADVVVTGAVLPSDVLARERAAAGAGAAAGVAAPAAPAASAKGRGKRAASPAPAAPAVSTTAAAAGPQAISAAEAGALAAQLGAARLLLGRFLTRCDGWVRLACMLAQRVNMRMDSRLLKCCVSHGAGTHKSHKSAYGLSFRAHLLLLCSVHGEDAEPTEDSLVAAAVEEAQAAAAAASSRSSPAAAVDAVHDFWVQVLDKHEGPGPCAGAEGEA